MFTHSHEHTHTFIHQYIYICMHSYTYIHTNTYTYVHTHTHTQTNIHTLTRIHRSTHTQIYTLTTKKTLKVSLCLLLHDILAIKISIVKENEHVDETSFWTNLQKDFSFLSSALKMSNLKYGNDNSCLCNKRSYFE